MAEQIFTVASRHPRAATPEKLAKIAADLGGRITPVAEVAAALEQSMAEVGRDGLICVTGSLFLVADVREIWLRRTGQPLPPIDPMVIST